MLRVTPNSSADGTHKYFFGYYSETELDVSKWHGKAAEKLGLSGEIKDHDFQNLCFNIHPQTGEQLTARNAENRLVGYDFTFSVPKSVSLVHAFTQDKEILSAFQNSINKTMQHIEENAETRVRLNGASENRDTGNLVWGTFTHGQSRPVDGIPDPNLHKHVFIFNATYDNVEDKWKAAKFRNLKADAPFYESIFRSHMADELQNVGYAVERNKNDFEIKGFERSTIKKFSRRTAQIEDKAKELGIIYAEDKSQLGAKTRVQKIKDLDQKELFAEWQSRLNESELHLIENAKNNDNNFGGGNSHKEIDAEKALDYSLSHNLERKSTATEKEIYLHALKRSYGSVTPDQIKDELVKRKDLLSKQDGKNKIFTTKEALAEERNLKQSARNGRGTLKAINEGYSIKNEQLTHEQANAVQHVLKSKDFISIVSGGAGTGKTWSIKEVAQGVKEQNLPFGAFAPSSAASRQVQRKDGFKDATTIAELIQSKEIQQKLKGGMIWLDEAGMVGNKTMNQVISIAKQQDARILLTGDIKQHNSVERGDALRIIQKYGGVKAARISKIQRQKVDGYKKAVELISNGKMNEGVAHLDKMSAIKEATDFNNLKENVAKEYLKSVKAKEDTLIVATTHSQGKAVTQSIRSQLKEANILKGEERKFNSQRNLSFTEAQKQDVANYQLGMSVQFHQNIKGGIKRGQKYQIVEKDKDGKIWLANASDAVEKKNRITLPIDQNGKYSVYENHSINLARGDKIRITQNGYSTNRKRINNGNILSIKGFDDNGNIIATSGKRELTLDKNFGNLTHGYYTTSPASQGKSVNRVIVMQSKMSGKAASKEQFYVSASRGKFAISVHTDDKANLLHSVNRSTQRMTAMEVAASNENAKQFDLKSKFQKLGSIYRAVKSRVENFAKSYDKSTPFKMNVKPTKQPIYAAPTRGK